MLTYFCLYVAVELTNEANDARDRIFGEFGC